MRVLFDHQIFAEQRYGGISRYFLELARALSIQPGVEPVIVAPLHINEYLTSFTGAGWRFRSKLRIRGSARLHDTVNRVLAPLSVSYFQPDVVHATYFRPCARKVGHPLVLTVYDMIHEIHAAQFPAADPTARLKQAAVAAADHVVCISRQTQIDLIERLGVPEHKTSVTYLAHSMPALPQSGKARSASCSPYILYVGHRGVYKNFEGFIRAYASSPALRSEFRVVCFGGGEFTPTELGLFSKLGLSMDQLDRRDGSDNDLQEAYVYAHAFVYPSLYEGFGIPPLEAMACGSPVVCSNTSSIPEVVGDAAEMFDPVSIESIREALERTCLDEKHRLDLVARGMARQAQFSWERCAKETLAVYQGL